MVHPKTHQKAISLLKSGLERWSSTQSLCVRDYIITKLLVANSSRSGDYMNFLMDEYHRRSVLPDGSSVIYVKTHKTSGSYGPVSIVCDREMSQVMAIYILKRPGGKADQDRFFRNRNGKPTSTGSIQHLLNRVYPGSQRIRASQIRATVATATASECSPKRRSLVCRKMAHSEATVARHYRAHVNPVQAATAVHTIATVLRLK